MSVTKSLNGKVNVNFYIFMLATIYYRTKLLSTGIQTYSKKFLFRIYIFSHITQQQWVWGDTREGYKIM